MKLTRSVCTNLFFPESRASAEAFARMADFLRGYGIGRIECYCDGHDAAGRAIADRGMDGVYIAVIPLKERRLHLCAADEGARAEAVKLACLCMDRAAEGGFSTLMINSGRPEGAPVDAAMDALVRSVRELFDHRARRGHALRVEMEPCDSGMEAMHLIGPSARTLELCRRLEREGLPLHLTMDTAHTAEEGEDFARALALLRPYCDHVHLANCLVDDPNDPLYGDKHLGYEFERGVWNFDALRALMPALEALYPSDAPLCVGLECLCREPDPFLWFDRTWRRLPEVLTCAQASD